MKKVVREKYLRMSKDEVIITVFFLLVAFHFYPVAGIPIKFFLIVLLGLYGFYFLVIYKKFVFKICQELRLVFFMYLVIIFGWGLNGVIVNPAPNYLITLFELSAILPSIIGIYFLLDERIKLSYSSIRRVSICYVACSFLILWGMSIQANISIADVFVTAISGGGNIQYLFFKRVFLEVGNEGSSARHTMVYVFFILVALLRSSRSSIKENFRPYSFTWLELTMVVFIIFIGASRKVVLALLVFYILSYIIETRFLWGNMTKGALIRSMGILTLSFAVLIGFAAFFQIDALENLRYRYTEDVLQNSRLNQYSLSISEVNVDAKTLLWGRGLGVRASDGYFPHNILVFSLHQGGILMAALATIFFGFLAWLSAKAFVLAFMSSSLERSYYYLAGGSGMLIAFTRVLVGNKGDLALIGCTGLVVGMIMIGYGKRGICR